MKRKFYVKKMLAFLVLFCGVLLLNNCEKRDEIVLAQQEKKEFVIEELNYGELTKDINFSDINENFKIAELQSEVVLAKGSKSKSSEKELDIDFSKVKKLITKKLISYTFLIKQEEKGINEFQNLTIEKEKETGVLRGYITKYFPQKKWFEGSKEKFKGSVAVSSYARNLEELINKTEDNIAAKTQCGRIHFFQIFIPVHCTSDYHHWGKHECDCKGINCHPPRTEVYSYQTYVPCNDFSTPVDLNNTPIQGGGSSGSIYDEPSSGGASGSAVLGPNGINVPDRDYLVSGVSNYSNHGVLVNYIGKARNLYKFMEETLFVQYQNPSNKPIYKELKEIATLIYQKRYNLTLRELQVLYQKQKLIINILSSVNFDYESLPTAAKNEILKQNKFTKNFFKTKNLGISLSLDEKIFLAENESVLDKIAFFLNENRINGVINTKSLPLAKAIININKDTSITEEQKYNQFVEAYEIFDSTLPVTATQSHFEAKILEYAIEFRRRGRSEFANYLEKLVPFDSSTTMGEIRDLYDVIRKEKVDLFWNYFREIVGVTVDSFEPVVKLALFTLTGHFAIRVLQSLPIARVSVYLGNVITRLGIPSSSAFTAFQHAKKFGIQSYAQLKQEVINLGYTLNGLGVQRHHLIEQRFSGINGVNDWLGSSTNSWDSIMLTPEEHQAFTNAWRNAIPYANSGATLNTNTATLNDIKEAARTIYANYPEILEALGL